MSDNLDLGTTSAKYSSTDELLLLMRQIVSDGAARRPAMKAFKEALRNNENLQDEAFDYVANAYWHRCTTKYRGTHQESSAIAKMVEVASAKIVLWTWKLPTTGKPISDSTFAEIANAAPLTGRFLAKLATQGAAGSLVKEVFRNKEELQDFWLQSQK